MAAIGDLAERAPKTVSVLTIAVDAREEDVRRFVDKYGVQFPVIHDDRGDLGAKFQISGIPTTLLLDNRGVIVSRIVGPRDWSRDEFVSWMAMLAEPESE
jgi:peroxiredoxin